MVVARLFRRRELGRTVSVPYAALEASPAAGIDTQGNSKTLLANLLLRLAHHSLAQFGGAALELVFAVPQGHGLVAADRGALDIGVGWEKERKC
ncbi:hypothetical protein NUU61_001095 [Penicillium alfredii]|uniref:Uncharacterized protein n=1 Tax=Penicillium alfredii TaxID=1506179 RepID=A0A9W9KRM8_9EURO|nr:uncharacterized protein NUU61_001095 [Penicillium alfredii]KAJ5115336.1 hypothetical protein NUU61_001095 [Penicillium alfredii]